MSSDKENAIRNYIDIPYFPSQNGYHQNKTHKETTTTKKPSNNK
jgi:hypothetical protein